MSSRKKSIIWGTLTALLLGANIHLVSAHDWFSFHWHKRTLGTRMAVSSTFASAAEAARADWSNNTIVNLQRVNFHTDLSVFDGNFGDTGWGGLASVQGVTLDGFHCLIPPLFCQMTHAHAMLNTFYRWSSGSGTTSSARGVFCQEIGHTLGLDHSPHGCMGKGYFDGLKNNEPISNVTVSHNRSDIRTKFSPFPTGRAASVP